MIEKEVAELRRRYKADKSNITHVVGCYVNENKEIISRFYQSIAMLSEDEQEKMFSLLRKALSGAIGKNLLDITFETRQVVEGEEHKLLMDLRASKLKDEAVLDAFFQKAIQSLELESNYLILLAHDAYDVPYRTKDGERQDDAGNEVFSYVLCAICPVKQTKPALSYSAPENEFHNLAANRVISAPEAGFLFPAFDDRSTNLYNALFYTRNVKETQEAFVEAIFRQSPPMPAAQQMATFQNILGASLEDDCSYQAVKAVGDQLRDIITEHKINKEEENLVITKGTVKQVLENCGVEETSIKKFDEHFDESFGQGADLPPWNLVNTKKMEIKTPDVTIQVDPLKSDLVETRVINGGKYILIRAEDGVEVDGVFIHIQ